MKIKKLTIQNLASIESATIDFANGILAEQGLFLICGPTGSGKSTILDAICLALFNKTPRIDSASKDIIDNTDANSLKISNVLHLVRKNAAEAFVQLEFEGIDGCGYTAQWHVARKRNKTELRKPEWTLIDDKGNIYEKGTRGDDSNSAANRIEAAIGMNFNQFCKTTMLAQGNFTKFLSSSAEEKALILEKLVGTEIYARVGSIINKTSNAKKNKVEVLTDALKNFIFLSPEDKSAKETDIQQFTEDVEHLNKQSEQIESKLKWIEKRNQITHDAEVARQALVAANEALQTEEAKEQAVTIALWDRTTDLRFAIKEWQQGKREEEEQQRQAGQFGKDLNSYFEQGIEAVNNKVNLTYNTEIALVHWQEAKRNCERKQLLVRQLEQKQTDLQKLSKIKQDLFVQTEAAYNATKEAYEKTKDAVSDHAKALRAELKVGDNCPVCGNVVERVLSEDSLRDLIQPLITQYKIQENAYRAVVQELAQVKADIDSNAEGLNTTRIDAIDAQTKQQICWTTLQERCGQLGIPCDEHTPECLEDIKRENAQAQKAIALVAAMQRTAQKIVEKEQEIALFLQQHPDITRERVLPLLSVSNVYIATMRDSLKRLADAKTRAIALQDKVNQQLTALPNCPLQEEDTIESLTEQKAQLTLVVQQKLQAIGFLRKELQTDDENVRRMGQHKIELEKAQTEYKEWKFLDDYLGSTGGKRFRDIAQSMILGDLLETANKYLNQISGRYTLFCYPGTLTIMMRDAYQGGAVRPTNTLSGGEGFIVSLSLALGLSSMQNIGIEVDTLFIDEGFGTLSPEFIDPVIMALRRLYQTTGRKVGLVSHIETLRANIPAHIEVVRNGSSSSIVQIHI